MGGGGGGGRGGGGGEGGGEGEGLDVLLGKAVHNWRSAAGLAASKPGRSEVRPELHVPLLTNSERKRKSLMTIIIPGPGRCPQNVQTSFVS